MFSRGNSWDHSQADCRVLFPCSFVPGNGSLWGWMLCSQGEVALEAKAEAATALRGENLVSSFSGAGGAWLGLPVICSLVSLGVVSRKKK